MCDTWPQEDIRLHIIGDKALLNEAREYRRNYGATRGAEIMLKSLNERGITHTPNGARYTKTSLRLALLSFYIPRGKPA